MIEKQTLSNQQIIECIRTHYHLEIRSLIPLHLGADMSASVYKAETHDQSSYFVKLRRGRQDISTAVQTLLHEAGIEQIIPPMKTIHSHAVHQLNTLSLSVYPFIQGQDGFHRNLTKEQWFMLGKALRRIHEFNIPPSLQNQVRHEIYAPKWRQIVRSLPMPTSTSRANDVIAQQFNANQGQSLC